MATKSLTFELNKLLLRARNGEVKGVAFITSLNPPYEDIFEMRILGDIAFNEIFE